MDKVLAYLKEHRDEHVQWAVDLCRIPSISTKEQHKGDVRRAAEWTHALCERIGLKSAIHETGGHPAVVAEWCEAKGAPTILVYGHLDVQPEGDLSLWDAPPFEPTIKDDWLICRGSADDKGQVLVHLRTVAAWLATEKRLPVNVKFLIEAEEEISSPNLAPFIEKHKAALACDVVVISDTGLYADGCPTITAGTRGLVYKELRLHGPKHDVHSGSYGGSLANPANVLAMFIAGLHDEKRRVTIPGFYDDVVELSAAERKDLAALPFDEKTYMQELGVPGLLGEAGYTTNERRTIRPTLDVNGIYGGFMAEGANTIIPMRAGAKISMRLVPFQQPEKISAAFDQTVRERIPNSVKYEILNHGQAAAYMSPPDSKYMRAARKAMADAFGKDTVVVREGGSLPILPMFKEKLGADCLLLGFASPSCAAHGPNEKVWLKDLDRGAESCARLLKLLADG